MDTRDGIGGFKALVPCALWVPELSSTTYVLLLRVCLFRLYNLTYFKLIMLSSK